MKADYQRNSAGQERALLDQINDLNLQQSSLSAKRQSARQTIRTFESKIADLQNSLDSLSVDEADLAVLKTSMEETTSALQTAQDEFAQKAWDTKLANLDVQISTVEEGLKAVQTELTSASAQNEFRAKLDVLRNDLSKKTQSRSILISSHAERFKKLVGIDLTDASQESQINVLLRRKADDLEEAERLLEGTAKEITQLEAKLNACKEQLRDKRKERNEAYAKVMGAAEDLNTIDEFPKVTKSCEDQVANVRLYSTLCPNYTDCKSNPKRKICWEFLCKISSGSKYRPRL